MIEMLVMLLLLIVFGWVALHVLGALFSVIGWLIGAFATVLGGLLMLVVLLPLGAVLGLVLLPLLGLVLLPLLVVGVLLWWGLRTASASG